MSWLKDGRRSKRQSEQSVAEQRCRRRQHPTGRASRFRHATRRLGRLRGIIFICNTRGVWLRRRAICLLDNAPACAGIDEEGTADRDTYAHRSEELTHCSCRLRLA